MPKMFVDQDIIRDLATLLNETDLTEIEIQDGEKKIRVARSMTITATTVEAHAAQTSLAPEQAENSAVPVANKDHPGAVTSPMVGTLYTAQDPTSGNFINVGDKVTVGQTLMIIEAMKVMNQIHATRAGTVTQIFVENSQPVEYGEVLAIIE